MDSPARTARIRNFAVAAILGATIIGFSAASVADPNSASITVRYADLNPATPAGAQLLYQRIRSAARSACNYFWFKTDADEAACVAHTIANSVGKVNQPALTAVYNSHDPILSAGALVSRAH